MKNLKLSPMKKLQQTPWIFSFHAVPCQINHRHALRTLPLSPAQTSHAAPLSRPNLSVSSLTACFPSLSLSPTSLPFRRHPSISLPKTLSLCLVDLASALVPLQASATRYRESSLIYTDPAAASFVGLSLADPLHLLRDKLPPENFATPALPSFLLLSLSALSLFAPFFFPASPADSSAPFKTHCERPAPSSSHSHPLLPLLPLLRPAKQHPSTLISVLAKFDSLLFLFSLLHFSLFPYSTLPHSTIASPTPISPCSHTHD